MKTLLLFCLIFGHGFLYSDYRVTLKDFKWQITSFDNIEIYHYKECRSIVNYVKNFLKDAQERTIYLRENIEYKIPLFLYSSQNDFEQSTIADIDEGTGGVAEAFKNRLLIGHRGSLRNLNHVVVHEYTHAIQYSILFSGLWRSPRLLKFVLYPLWLLEGLAEYSSGDLDVPEREMYVRDAVLNKKNLSIMKLHNFSHLEPHQVKLAYKTSELLMRFIAEEYGEEKLRELLVTFKDSYDSNTVLLATLGLNIGTLDFKFNEFLMERYENFKDLNKPIGEQLTHQHIKYPTFNVSPVMSQDRKIIYYLSDRRGRNEIWQTDLISKKSSVLIGLHNNEQIDYINPEGRAISLSPDGKKLIFIGEKNKKDFLCIYDVYKKQLIKKSPPINYSSLATPSFFPDGNTVVFSAMVESIRDIYTYNLVTDELTQLTSDIYDDIDPVVSGDAQYIIYSSERKKSTPEGLWDYDLYRLDIQSKSVEKLTEFEWDERTPYFSADGRKILFCAEPDTIRNIYLMDLTTKETLKITQTAGGCFTPSFISENEVVFSLFYNGKKDIYKLNISTTLSVKLEADRPNLNVSETKKIPVYDSEVRPYRFSASTDLFFPFLYYSSVDGLFLATYWRFSDMLGHHNFYTGVLYVDYRKRLNYLAQYTFMRFRPQLVLAASGNNTYFDWLNQRFARYDEIVIGATYPLDRFRKIDFYIDVIYHKFTQPNKVDIFREDLFHLTYVYHSVTRKYLEPITGGYLRINTTVATDSFGGVSKKQNFSVENRNYYQLSGEYVCLWRILTAASFDRSFNYYSLGGRDRVRGYRYPSYLRTKILINSLELRIPIVSNINYYIWYLIPDFFFKSFLGTLFIDGGVGWDKDLQNSYKIFSWGGGLKLYSFVLQSFPVLFKLEWAKPFSPEPEKWYFSIASHFD